MGSIDPLIVLLVAALCAPTNPEPAPQFHPSGFPRDQPPRSDRRWAQAPRNHSISTPNFDFLDPATSPVAEEGHKTHVPRQSGLYGAPPNPLPFGYPGRNQYPLPPAPPQAQPSGYPQGFSQGSPQGFSQGFPQGFSQGSPQGFPQGFQQGFSQGFPQIYKVDNLIIIANPPQQVACTPTSSLKPLDPNTFPGTDNDPDNRFGDSDEPTKCTWAIVACCAPGSPTVRYNCFELMGCPGLFLDQNPCSPTIIEAATRAALAFYRNANSNSTTTATDNNRV